MPEFSNREEYEKWKEERLKSAREKADAEGGGGPPKDFSPGAPRAGAGPVGNLRSISELFGETYAIYKERIGTLIGIIVLSALFAVAAVIIAAAIGLISYLAFPVKKQVAAAIGVAFGVIPVFTVLFWGFAAFVFAVVHRTLGIKDAFGKGWKRLGAFLWLYSIMGFIVTGGFLLFVVPGIVFSVWFAFSQFILARDGERGMNALLKSREYVRGVWFEVCGRLLVIWFVSLIVGGVPFLGPLLSIFFMPFVMIYTYLIYEDLVAMKGPNFSYGASAASKCKWLVVGTLGYLALPLIFIAIFGAAVMLPILMLKGMLHIAPVP